MRMRNSKYVWFLLLVILCYLFNIFAYEIESVNARIRNLLITGNTQVRIFNDKGLPISSNPNVEGNFISPFYVVHYGLIYSQMYNDELKKDKFHWKEDTSIEFWNVPPKNVKREYFKNAVDWLVENLDTSFKEAHFIYNFDWGYKGYPNGMLKAPWWSGLTDAYSIILLLRAYDIYGDEQYINAAEALYKSSIEEVKLNGSLTYLHGDKWIEEYVDPNANPNKLAYVLNGMIYSTFGIKAYEDAFAITNGETQNLIKSIERNISLFDKGSSWSNYDLIGNTCNMKYHRIHIALMNEMYNLTGANIFKEKKEQWKKGVKNIGFNWVINSTSSIAKKMYLTELFLIIMGFGLLYYKRVVKR